MTKYLIITRTAYGWAIKDTIYNTENVYIDYTLREAIALHRKHFNLHRKHFTKIFL